MNTEIVTPNPVYVRIDGNVLTLRVELPGHEMEEVQRLFVRSVSEGNLRLVFMLPKVVFSP